MAAEIKKAPVVNSLVRQFPYRLLNNDVRFCEWIANTPANFTEPFFDETISRLKAADVNQKPFKRVSDINLLADWAARTAPGRRPNAIIFHVSRCGSTLFSQLLALQPQHMVLSEVPFLDELLRLPFKDVAINAEQAGKLFHAALQFYINSAHQSPAHVFIKADSWHLHFYEQLRMLYPGVPFILLYRDPWEVLQSQQRRRSMQSVPGILEPAVFGFGAEQAAEHNLDKYMASVLQSYFGKIISIAKNDPNSILINYSEGAVAGLKKIYAAVGIAFDSQYEAIVGERTGFNAKYPEQIFKEANEKEVPPAYSAQVMALYGQVEKIRLQPALV